MSRRVVMVLARREVRDALRNRWFLVYAGAFVVLNAGLAFLVVDSAGYTGVSGFGRTAAGLVNLVLFLAPLMGLTLGAQALAGERERGTLAYLLAQPVSAADVFVGKYAGLALAMAIAIVAGFSLSTLIVGTIGSSEGLLTFAGLTALTVLLGWVSLSLGYLISSRARHTASALGVAVAAWVVLTLIGDLGLMGTAVVARLKPEVLLAATLVNPLESYRIASVYLIRGSPDLFGPAGLVIRHEFGGAAPVVLALILLVWLIVPLAIAFPMATREVRG